MDLPDTSKLTWELHIALAGAVFSVFALIYNSHYIAYGFVTFVYGVLAHIMYSLDITLLEKKSWKNSFYFIALFLLTFLWIVVLIVFYN